MTNKAQIGLAMWLVFWLLGLFIVGGTYVIGRSHGVQSCEAEVNS